MLEAFLEVWEQGYFEVGEAFKGLKDEHVWQRPADGLLSIGEIAGHIAYWEALKFTGQGRDFSTVPISSPLLDARFAYYTDNIERGPTDDQRKATAEGVFTELTRIHHEAITTVKSLNPDLGAVVPGWPSFWTYKEMIKYAAFHVAYHTGQMYSVRHLLGEQTPDN